MTNSVLGTKIKMIQGYKGTAAANLAMERGEIEGLFNIWEGMKSLNADWLRDGKINLVVQFVTHRHPELPNVPAIIEAARTDGQRDVIRLFLSTAEVGRTILMPPDVPTDRVEAVRVAFAAMLKDPDFLADAKAQKMELTPMLGADLQRLNEDTFKAPAAAIALAQKIMNE
jgi:tripartite-type tricarboxylate transporter receptor subunit TctC